MKVWLNGATHFAGQVPRIAAGFREIGWEVTEYITEADLVYSNNSHEQVIKDKGNGTIKPGAKVILTCLDIPLHLLPGFDMKGLGDQLSAADAVCAISEYGQWQLDHYLGIKSHVIYQPVKPVSYQPEISRKPFYRFAHIGRRTDPNKHFQLGPLALNLLGYTQNDLCLIGNEPGWGDYVGVLNDENLNIIYNSVDFVFCLGKIEGLSLTPIEAAAAGAIPIICNHLTTREELFPTDIFPEYEDVHPTPRSIATFISYFVNEESGDRMREMKFRLRSHFNLNLKEKVSPAGVARRIEAVYKTLT